MIRLKTMDIYHTANKALAVGRAARASLRAAEAQRSAAEKGCFHSPKI